MKFYDASRLEDRLLPRVLDFQAAENPETTWLWTDERRLTFRACAELSKRYAAGLSALGIVKGATISMVMVPSIEVVLIAMAAARLGAIFTTINTDYHGQFLQEAIAQCQSTVVIIDGELAARLEGLDLAQVQHVIIHGEARAPVHVDQRPLPALLEAGDELPAVDLNWSDPVQVWWSSGTTGKSKGVIHGHSSLIHLAHRQASRRVQPGYVYYSCTPMYLGSPWTGTIWQSLVSGTTAAIDAKFSARQFWDRIRYYGAKSFFTLGAMHMHLWKQEPTPRDESSGVLYGQAIPMSWELIPQFKARFGIEIMDQAYGTSETFMVFEAHDDGTPWKGAAMGRPVPYLDVKLMDENDCEVPIGEAGEICVRPNAPGVMFLGYFNAPDMTVQAWRNLWHHTGDMAIRDEDGVYYFADRRKDYIRYNGRNISMFEVEAVLETHPDIADVAAYGITSAELESEAELMLGVVLKPDRELTAEDIARYINKNAPYYFVPRYIEFLHSLPRNAHGRVMKHILRERGVTGAVWDRRTSGFVVSR